MCAQQGRASRPTSTPTSVFPHSQYQFAAQSGSGLVYDASAFYPPASSIPLPISKSSSSSLAAALVPTPEPEPVPARRPRSESTGCAAEQVKNQKAPASSSMTPNREGEVTHPTDMPNPPARSDRRQFVDESASAALRAQSQMYQGAGVHGHDATQSHSSGHFSYTHSQVPSASISTSTLYPHTHQQLAYVQPDESLWMPDAAFSSYPITFPLPPTATVAGPSHFSPFPQDFTCSPTGVGPALDIYGAGEGMEEWAFAQGNTVFPAPETYFDFNAASAGAGAWSEPSSFVPQYQIQNGPSTSITMPAITAFDRRTGNGFASGTGSNSDSGQSAFDGSYFNKQEYSQQQQQHQQNGSTSSGYGIHGLAQGQHQSPTIGQSYGEEQTQNSFLHSQSRQSASLSPAASSPLVHARAHSTQPTPVQVTETQTEVETRQKPQDSSALMPPPPLPARARPLGSERPQSRSRTSRTALERRHTVTAPSVPNGLTLDVDTSPSVATTSSASARSSSAAPESSSSSSLRDGSTHEGPATPKMATVRLPDAMWAQAQERYRCALPEAFRIHHASREPPAEMHIRETSALERSRGNDIALLSSLDEEEKIGQVVPAREGEEEAAAQAGAEAEGSNNADASEASTTSKDVSDEEFFSRPPGAGWTPARSGHEIGQEAASLKARARPGASSSSLVSPVSPTSADELVTPRDAYEFFPIRQAHMSYAYASPANPAALAAPPSSVLMHKVLSVIRHDAHFAPHVSGLGGSFQNAYDGRSYLTDDSEQDPEHVPPAPPGARSGDHPALAAFLPHPLAKRGQVWHELMNPAPQPRAPESEPDKREGAKDALNGENEDQRTEVEDEALKRIEEKGVKKEEKGEGWGFVEGGSHGSNLGLPDDGGPNKHSQRLKLSTDKKTPPKMACHFCRNRKIACGSSKCGDPSLCNQCERRNLRCIFPTISRRGMRTKGQRSAHTVDGTDEADKDSAENDEPLEYTGDYSASPDLTEPIPSGSGSGSSSLKKNLNPRKARQKGIKIKEAARGRGRGRRKGKVTTAEEGQEDLRGRENEDVEMDDVSREGASEMQVDRTSRYAEDPLASLAAEMQWQHRLSHPSQVTSSTQFGITSSSAFSASSSSMPSSSLSSALEFPSSSSFDVSFPMSVSGDSYSLHMGPSHGPFTTSPLHRKSQQGNAGDVRSSRL